MTTLSATRREDLIVRRRKPPGLVFYGFIVMVTVFGPTIVALAIALLRSR